MKITIEIPDPEGDFDEYSCYIESVLKTAFDNLGREMREHFNSEVRKEVLSDDSPTELSRTLQANYMKHEKTADLLWEAPKTFKPSKETENV